VTDEPEGLRDRLSKQGEEALGKLAEELMGNPMVASALQRAFDAREVAAHAQEAAMGALGIPSAADVERITRRLRSVSQRLEAIEDLLDRLEERIGSLDSRLEDASRSEPLERKLDEIARDLVALREAVTPTAEPVPRAQERLTVSEP
jgi:CRP-like cAMP-binding protein